MRVVLLTQYYPPEAGAPQNRLSDLAKRLVAMGHDVVVLTAMPNYPSGRVLDGYRGAFYRRETVDGITVHRSWIHATPSRAVVPRLANYFSFCLTALLVGIRRVPKADHILVESPPLFLGITGYLLARLKGARMIFNVADLWPKSAVELNIVTNPFMIGAATILEKFLYRRADLVTGQTEGIVEHVRQLAPRQRVHLFTNGVDVSRSAAPEVSEDPDQGDDGAPVGGLVFGYGGLHGHAQALDNIVAAAARLGDQPDVMFTLFGDGPEKDNLQRLVRERGMTNVHFFPLQPSEKMPEVLARWDVAVVSLGEGELMRGALPSKMFEAMGAGLPVLLSAPAGEASAVIEKAGAGMWVPAGDIAALSRAVMALCRDPHGRAAMGSRGRAYVRQHYDRQEIARRFAMRLEQLTDAVGHPGSQPQQLPGRR